MVCAHLLAGMESFRPRAERLFRRRKSRQKTAGSLWFPDFLPVQAPRFIKPARRSVTIRISPSSAAAPLERIETYRFVRRGASGSANLAAPQIFAHAGALSREASTLRKRRHKRQANRSAEQCGEAAPETEAARTGPSSVFLFWGSLKPRFLFRKRKRKGGVRERLLPARGRNSLCQKRETAFAVSLAI